MRPARDGFWRCGPENLWSRSFVSVSYASHPYGERRRSLREVSFTTLSSLFVLTGEKSPATSLHGINGLGVQLQCGFCAHNAGVGWESLSSGMFLSFTWIINCCFSDRLPHWLDDSNSSLSFLMSSKLGGQMMHHIVADGRSISDLGCIH